MFCNRSWKSGSRILPACTPRPKPVLVGGRLVSAEKLQLLTADYPTPLLMDAHFNSNLHDE